MRVALAHCAIATRRTQQVRIGEVRLEADLHLLALLEEPDIGTFVRSRLFRSEDYKGHREMIEAWPLVLARSPERSASPASPPRR